MWESVRLAAVNARVKQMREGQPTGYQQVASYRRTAGHESGICRTGSRFCFKEWFIPVFKIYSELARGDSDSLDLPPAAR